jgi:DNA-binding NtrC family response regulator
LVQACVKSVSYRNSVHRNKSIIEEITCQCALEAIAHLQSLIRTEQTQVIVLAQQPSAAEAMRCIQRMARDYRAWPLMPSELLELTERVRQRSGLLPTESAPDKSADSSMMPGGRSNQKDLIGASRALLELSRQMVRVAEAHHLPVFINGETGTGKEVVARKIHELSGRPGTFRAINCAAMVESLLESELFGHEKGAFTGAHTTKKGLWEEASQGTIFLDEITEASPAMQAKLLRVLQEGTIRRVGATQEIRVTARVMAASNRPLEKAVKDGSFREDLFYRLGQVLRVPPLRERVEDIPLLIAYFIRRSGQGVVITPEALTLLCRYGWPGNVRELESLIQRLIAFHGRRILPEDVRLYLALPDERTGLPVSPFLFGLMNATPLERWPTIPELKHQYVIEAYRYFGQKHQVARALGIDYRTVMADGQVFQIPTLVPRRQSNGACRFLTADNRCAIHAVSPFGCSHFDVHQSRDEADRISLAGLQAIAREWATGGLYARLWTILHAMKLDAPSPIAARGRLKEALLSGHQ